MKIPYEKPMIAIERYELTQTIASCNLKIGLLDSECVLKDPDSTRQMKDFAQIGWFTSGECSESANGMEDTDGICYHTNINAAFNS